MAQVTIRNVDEGTLAELKRRALAQGRSVSAVSRDILAEGARGRFPDAVKSDALAKAALAKMERVWENWESEPRVEGCSSELIREGREERTAAIEGRTGAAGRRGNSG